MKPNGDVVIDRLESLERSLTRALERARHEVNRRDSETSYNLTYLSQLAHLAQQAFALEDEVERVL